ncbi:MAG: heme A synthase [bacterium]
MKFLNRYWTHLATLVLGLTILAGSLVHATGSSLACPDWPLCFGKFAPAMEGPVLYEHSHRLIAGTAGVLVWISGFLHWFVDTSLRRKVLVMGMMVLIVVQAVLGGITVLYQLPSWVSTLHFLLAHLTFGGFLTLSWAHETDGDALPPGSAFTRWQSALVILAPLLLFFQMGLGAWLRHIGTKGAPMTYQCKLFPFCDPTWIEYMTSYYLSVYWLHRYTAVAVTGVILLLVWSFREYRDNYAALYQLPLAASGVILLQIVVGDLSVRTYLAVSTTTLHSGLALIVFCLLLWHTLILYGRSFLESP